MESLQFGLGLGPTGLWSCHAPVRADVMPDASRVLSSSGPGDGSFLPPPIRVTPRGGKRTQAGLGGFGVYLQLPKAILSRNLQFGPKGRALSQF